MNRQGKGKIEYLDFTWNPVTGCLHNCPYCYARKITNRFGGASETHYNETVGEECQWYTEETKETHDLLEPIYDVDRGHNAPYPFYFDPTFHRYRLDEPQKVKKSSIIGTVYMGDLFGDWVLDEWIEEVFKACEKAPWHKYLFLTKNPGRYYDLYCKKLIPCKNNYWFGTTLTKPSDEYVWLEKAPYKTFVSMEPLLEGFGELEKGFMHGQIPKWVIIGQQTGPNKPPKNEWVQSIIDQCRAAGVPVFVKSPLYEKFPVHEWPEGLEVSGC
ncbi:MAG: Phage protein Gp37/Gp68 [Bacteroidetes bacterium ADurb.Bin397]|nr:MAG: Phage protein Gp37/Gp68 [Bacteroidetes bacterium ADurb.Bin397]